MVRPVLERAVQGQGQGASPPQPLSCPGAQQRDSTPTLPAGCPGPSHRLGSPSVRDPQAWRKGRGWKPRWPRLGGTHWRGWHNPRCWNGWRSPRAPAWRELPRGRV